MERSTLVAAAVAALLVTSGCAGIDAFAGDAESPPDGDVVRRFASLETVEASQVTSVDAGDGVNETRAHVRIDLTGDRYRQYQRVVSPESRAGDITVFNETGSILYDADENTVTRVPWTGRNAEWNQSAYLARIVEAAREDEVAEPSDGVSPLPVVPATGTGPSIPENAIEGFEVEYLGTETVADRTAYGFELTAVSEAALTGNQTLWLDSEYYYPLKTSRQFDYGNRTIETTARLTNVTFNGALPEDAFGFDAPENATVETLNVSSETFDSPSALRERANFTVPEPEVPEGYEFDQAQFLGGNTTQASLEYVDGDGERLTVTKMAYVSNTSNGLSGEAVTVAGQEGEYVTTSRAKLVLWSCGDTQYSVVATDLDEEAVLDVAESVGCG